MKYFDMKNEKYGNFIITDFYKLDNRKILELLFQGYLTKAWQIKC